MRCGRNDKKGRGKLAIEYAHVNDFDAILAALGQPN
jgi:hypothetical protein